MANAVIEALDFFRSELEEESELGSDQIEAVREKIEAAIRDRISRLAFTPPYPVRVRVSDVGTNDKLHFKIRLSTFDFERDEVELTDMYTLEVSAPN